MKVQAGVLAHRLRVANVVDNRSKRVVFSSIQASHVIWAKGYTVNPLRTGGEQVVSFRTTDMFASHAMEDGEIVAITKTHLEVKYASGDIKRIEIGQRFGKAAGSVIPHNVVVNSSLKVGSKVKAGELLTYNDRYFKQDWLAPNQASWMSGILVKTALNERMETFEDSSMISAEVAKQLETETTYMRQVVVDFDKGIRNLVKPGDTVELDSILCTIEDAVTATSGLFDPDALETLQRISAINPRSDYVGRIDRVEVLYNGNIDDMSDTLAELANSSDRELQKKHKLLGSPITSGKVDGTYRVNNNPLANRQLVINVYITSTIGTGTADKGVFANQMKTIFAGVMSGVNETEHGDPLGAFFSFKSISNRIVESAIMVGTTNTLCLVRSKQIAKAYFEGE